jgi:light-regulated signal transduction histidine kinase (bacteriophytochrome)
LISNAVKFTSRKEVAEIQFGYEDKEKDYEFFIKDNGAGFNMEYYDKLFGVFQRLHSKEEFEGTGIGLASVKRIITRHGGSIYADAKENEGATFYFKIPKIV